MSAPASMSDFQDAFVRALLRHDPGAPAPPDPMAAIVAQPGFAVYRNTVMKGCIDALAANFPAVLSVVGEEWFRAAAACYAPAHPPVEPSLICYGASFPEYLATFEHARDLPYLPDVARLDRAWTEAHTARDQAPFAASALATDDASAFERIALVPHASARWAWFEAVAVVSLWRLSRFGCDQRDGTALAARSEGVLILRPQASVENHDLGLAGIAFLDACAAGKSILHAALAALAADAGADLSVMLATLLGLGAFAGVRTLDQARKE